MSSPRAWRCCRPRGVMSVEFAADGNRGGTGTGDVRRCLRAAAAWLSGRLHAPWNRGVRGGRRVAARRVRLPSALGPAIARHWADGKRPPAGRAPFPLPRSAVGAQHDRRRSARRLSGLFGRRAGGIGIASFIVGALFAPLTSAVGATVLTIGLLSLPSMLNAGYDNRLASGIVCSAG